MTRLFAFEVCLLQASLSTTRITTTRIRTQVTPLTYAKDIQRQKPRLLCEKLRTQKVPVGITEGSD